MKSKIHEFQKKMMTSSKTKILYLVATLLFFSCNKDNADAAAQLPPATQTGANTFGAIINGQIMLPRTTQGYRPPGSNHYAVRYTKSNRWEEIIANDGISKMGGIYLYIENSDNIYPLKVQNYSVGNSNGAFSNSLATNTLITAVTYDKNGNVKIYLSIADTGTINITRSDDAIISGTFSCKLSFENDPNDIIEIKEGRFDFTKNTIYDTIFK